MYELQKKKLALHSSSKFERQNSKIHIWMVKVLIQYFVEKSVDQDIYT